MFLQQEILARETSRWEAEKAERRALDERRRADRRRSKAMAAAQVETTRARGVYLDDSVPPGRVGFIILGRGGEELLRVSYPRKDVDADTVRTLWQYCDEKSPLRAALRVVE